MSVYHQPWPRSFQHGQKVLRLSNLAMLVSVDVRQLFDVVVQEKDLNLCWRATLQIALQPVGRSLRNPSVVQLFPLLGAETVECA